METRQWIGMSVHCTT